MFASHERLRAKTPQNGIGRREYIEHLVEEFHTTTNVEAQEQVTANLANFAYDPINFEYLRKASAIDLFLNALSLPNERLVHFGTAGVSNICLDPISRLQITKASSFESIFTLYQSTENIEVAINILTLFHLLLSEEDLLKEKICTPDNLRRIRLHKDSQEKRLKTIATVLLEDFCTQSEGERNAQKIH